MENCRTILLMSAVCMVLPTVADAANAPTPPNAQTSTQPAPQVSRSTTSHFPFAAACTAVEANGGSTLGGPAANPAPAIMPMVQKWAGGSGAWMLSNKTRILVDEPVKHATTSGNGYVPMSLMGIAQTLAADLREIAASSSSPKGFTPAIVRILPGMKRTPYDIVLSTDMCDFNAKEKIGTEGNTILLSPATGALLRANDVKGVFYASRTLVQAIRLGGSAKSVPAGYIVDYPNHSVRSVMLDVGRLFMKKEFLKDYMKFMSYYKLNVMRLHLNDMAWGYNKNAKFIDKSGNTPYYTSAFRLQSSKWKNLVTVNPTVSAPGNQHSNTGQYSRQDWAEMENVAAQYGIEIRPEFDSPAHAMAFINAGIGAAYSNRPDTAGGVFDLTNKDVLPNMEALISEFAPWFHSRNIHIGGDEVPANVSGLVVANYGANLANFITRFLKNADGKPFSVSAWNNLYNPSAPLMSPLASTLTLEAWDTTPPAYLNEGVKKVIDSSYNFYVVPNSNNENSSALAVTLYNNFNTANNAIIGGQICEWNDNAALGLEEPGINNALKDMIPAAGQTFWRGRVADLSGGTVPYGTIKRAVTKLGYGPQVTLKGTLTP
nr:family 20 glycosylhydrolase [Chromobacterium sp. ASV5]